MVISLLTLFGPLIWDSLNANKDAIYSWFNNLFQYIKDGFMSLLPDWIRNLFGDTSEQFRIPGNLAPIPGLENKFGTFLSPQGGRLSANLPGQSGSTLNRAGAVNIQSNITQHINQPSEAPERVAVETDRLFEGVATERASRLAQEPWMVP